MDSRVLVVLVGVVPAVAFADDSGLRGRKFGEDGIEVGGWQSSVSPGGRDAAEGRGGPRSGERLSGSPVERICPPVLYTYGAYRQVITDCEGAGGTEYAPYFERVEGGPVDPREVRVQVITVTREEVQRIIVDSGELIVQPGRPWVLVNAETVAMTDAAERIVGTQVLEVDVEVRVTPVLYTWDFGDGSAPLTGTDPGAPWPNHTVSHVYETPGTVTISLRTEWDAAFRVAGTSTWLPVAGRAVTTQSTDPIEVLTATPRLTAG